LLDSLALDCVGKRARQQAAIELTLDQVVLRAELYQAATRFRIVPFAQHHNRCPGIRSCYSIHRLLRGTVRKREAEQDDLEGIGCDKLESVGETDNNLDLKLRV